LRSGIWLRVRCGRAVPASEERCFVLLRGLFEVRWADTWHRVGPRADVFGDYPSAVYLGPGTSFRIAAQQPCEIADCRASSSRRGEARVIRPDDCGFEIRGGGNATRQIVDIVRPDFPADRLLLCEVYTPGGNWSSYPPHKHDTDDPPREVDLDEVYYFRFRDRAGYGFQRVYSRPARRDGAGHARRRRGRARRLSPVCYSAWIRCLLPERARGQSPLDGGERRPGARQIPAALAAARPAAADGSAARGQRSAQ
jgi:5-deoxy-glucuronate isomerase